MTFPLPVGPLGIRLRGWLSGLPHPYLPVIERPDERRNLVAMILQGEVTGVEHVQLRILEITLKRARPFLGEDRVVRSPHDERWRLILAQILVPPRVLFDVGPVIVEQVELN